MGFEIAAIDHLVLRTTRLQAMIDFYNTVLGCAVEKDRREELGLVQLRAGSGLIDLVDVNSLLGQTGGGPPGDSGNNLDHFCLQVDVVSEQDILDRLAEHGIDHGDLEQRYGAQGYGNSVYLSDPDGNTVELRKRF